MVQNPLIYGENMLTRFLKNWIADIVSTVAKGLGLTKDNVKMQADDKVFEATITFNNGTEYVYYISPGEDENGQVVFIDRIDGKGATKECRTKSQIIDFLTNDINTGLVAEATEILEQQGYRVVLNESTQIDEAINNPDEPASKKQLWALFCITKQDWRDKNLTKGEASELIQKYSGERTTQNKEALSVNSIKKDIIQNLKPKLDKQMAKAFGMQSVVGDADLEGNLIPGRKRYKFFGSGCGWAWVKYDKRNKKLGEVLDKYDDVYRKVFFEKFANEYIKKYKERELGAVLSQDIDIQCIIKQAALDYAESIGINTKGAYVNSRLD
jgi:predicted Fe-Mo cluster-binding NifX family protein